MKTNKITLNKWSDFKFQLNYQILTNSLILLALDTSNYHLLSELTSFSVIAPKGLEFTVEGEAKSGLFIKSPHPSFEDLKFQNYKLLILFKIKTVNQQIRTISYMQTIGIRDFKSLYQLFTEYWNLKTDEYHLGEISEIIFTYKIVDLSLMNYSIKNLKTNIIKPELQVKGNISSNAGNKFKFGGFNLPSTMDFTTWGDCHFINDTQAIVYKKSSSLEYHIKLFYDYSEVEVRSNNKTILSFKDTMIHKNEISSFSRILKNQEYIFDNGEVIIKKIHKKVSFLNKIRKDMHNSKKFITMDLETRIINEVMTSYCVSIYDGKIFKSFYLTDFSSEKEMLRESLFYLMKRKYHNHRIYLHNFSRFDSVFLLSVMTDLSNNVQPIIINGNIINLKFIFANKYTLYFRDSLLLLPGTLRSLAKNFNVEAKGLFPYKFVNNPAIPLDYIGRVPSYIHFVGVSDTEYTLYKSNFDLEEWNLRTETIKYCELDCLVLYQTINKFSDNIFNLFRIDILKYSTLSSLAFAIFKSNFLKSNNIPLIHGEMFDFLKQSYTGGNVDVYKPYSSNKVFRYDVNSLYPFVMKTFPMPVGTPIYFEGDILNNSNYNPNDKPFGIFEVDIIAPSNIKYPLLQTKIKTNSGFRTIPPLGNWSGVYFSDELYNASKFGYTFKVKRGYLFNKENIFTEYVDFLYNLKKNSTKGTPNYTISKQLLNSLYGRLGMNPIAEQHLILASDKAMELYPKIDITNILDLKNGNELISFFTIPADDIYDIEFNIIDTSVVISSVISASARIHMSQFKTDPKLNIFDTDSIDVNSELDPMLIGDELGQMKLEHIFDEAVFLGPKMYGGKTADYEYVRIKGLKNPIEFNELKPLLKKGNNLEIKQEKWYSDVSNGKFHIKDELYTLIVTDSKIKLLYTNDDLFYDTEPLTLVNGKLIE